MIEARELLGRLPEPDPEAVPRIWRRFRTSRRARAERRVSRVLVAAAAAVGLALALGPEQPQQRTLTSDGPTEVVWSDTARLSFTGHGTATGTSRDVAVSWESGTIRADVVPATRTALSVVTEEVRVAVVGTAFTVRRDPLGSTVRVEHGRVDVACVDGWSGELGPADGPHTCVPVRAAGLLGRADALVEAGAPSAEVLAALDAGLARAEAASAVEGELLARRVRSLGEAGRTAEALRDADRYLAAGHEGRRAEVLRAASRLALAGGGCGAATRWLEALGTAADAEDQVVLASCVAAADPARARSLARAALASGAPIDPSWAAWAAAMAGGRP